MHDWPQLDSTTAAVSTTSTTTVTVADTTKYMVNELIEIDQEAMVVRALASGTNLTVLRGARGTTAATHVITSDVLLRPAFTTLDILDALNTAIQATYPKIYKEVTDTSTTLLANTYEYTVPNMPGTYGGDTIPLPRIYAVDIRESSSTVTLPYRKLKIWDLRRGSSPLIKLKYLENPGATLRVRGYGPFPDLAYADSLDTMWPRNFIRPLVEMAGSTLLAGGEAFRARVDTGVRDDREAANRPGTAMSAASQIEARFLRRLSQVAMPPMRAHLVTQE